MNDWCEGISRAEYKAALAENIQKKLQSLADELGAERMEPLQTPKRGQICQEFWGQQWCLHLRQFEHWGQRLDRGRSLLRKGSVYAVEISEGYISAYVAGDDLYHVEIEVEPVSSEFMDQWAIATQGNPISMLDLWAGKLSPAVMSVLVEGEYSIFPQAEEIKMICRCDDWADMCEHSGAVLYGLGLLFEKNPEKIFQWRQVSPHDFIQKGTQISLNQQTENTEIMEEDLSDIFGIDLSNN